MASQTGSIDLTASNSVKLAAEAGWQSDLDSYYTKSEIDVTVNGINSTVSTKVGEDEVISSINQSSESVSINASKINLTGAVTISDLASDASGALTDAAKTATDYVTDINNNGITVHPKRSDYATSGGRAVINADGLTVYLGSDDVASYGASARIGKANSDRVTVDSTNGITIYKGNSKRLQTTANGINVYGSDGTTSIASFGATARIGKSNGTRVVVDTSSVKIIPNNKTANALTFEADDDYAQILYGNNYLNIGGVLFNYAYDLEAGTMWVSQGLHVGGSSTAGNPKFQVDASGLVNAGRKVVAAGNEMVALAASAVSGSTNRGLWDETGGAWIIYRSTDGSIVLGDSVSDGLYHRESTCTVTSANATIYNNYNFCWNNGACCTVQLCVNLKSNLANASMVDVATAPAGYRPPHVVFGSVMVTGQHINLQAEILGDGTIRVNNRSGTTVTSSANIYISFTFAP